MKEEQEVRVRMENVAVVLCRPKFPETWVGARCATNMGNGKLVVVGGEPLDREDVTPSAHPTARSGGHYESQ